jgi:predicted nucleotidyltransferase
MLWGSVSGGDSSGSSDYDRLVVFVCGEGGMTAMEVRQVVQAARSRRADMDVMLAAARLVAGDASVSAWVQAS